MTNREKFKEQILDIACSGSSIALETKTMKVVPCKETYCYSCYFHGSSCEDECDIRCKDWCDAEYVEPPARPLVDWSKVPVDTPILVRDNANQEWLCRYYAGSFNQDYVFAWRRGATSWSSCNKETVPWCCAKLAEDGEQ